MEAKEWLQLEITKKVIDDLYGERLAAMESVLSSSNKEYTAGIAVGITHAINAIEGLGEVTSAGGS